MHVLLLQALFAVALAAPSRRSEPAPLLRARDASQLIADRHIVKFKDDSTQRALDATIASLKNSAEHVYGGAFSGFATSLDAASLELLQDNPNVEYIEQDAVFHTTTEQVSAPWNLARISSRTPGATSYFHDDSAGLGTCAYVIDTGIDPTHPDFGGRAAQVANFAGGSNADGNGHGTHLAGIIAGSTYGVAKKATVLGVKVLGDQGSGSTSGIIAGLDFVASDAPTRSCPHGAVVNMSIGGGFSASLNSAVRALVEGGILVSVSAGNTNDNVANYSPASEPMACTVGGSDRGDTVASSNYGALLDVYAPGRDIVSTWPGGGT